MGGSGPKPRAVMNFSRAMITATKNVNGRHIWEWQLLRRSGTRPGSLAVISTYRQPNTNLSG